MEPLVKAVGVQAGLAAEFHYYGSATVIIFIWSFLSLRLDFIVICFNLFNIIVLI